MAEKGQDDSKVQLAEMRDVNFPLDATGRTFHVQARKGEVANRVITVGSHGRGEKLSKMLDQKSLITVRSNRAFVVYTGLFNNVPISIVVSCMGSANMDFVVREIRPIVDGELVIFRLGSCGGLKKELGVGSLAFSRECSFLQTNYDRFHHDSENFYYRISKPVPADEKFTDHVYSHRICIFSIKFFGADC
eukprot:TRINITY_DN3644_c0_g1_i2.p1 TRINITY_DN3644_c0_g1~~TRINITY_DN3644_c0_g1_i2.p1  ORF type:complete len:199 (-),score=41.98 TRINITY_DN3644_c0_g1_i2:17-589(-)